MELNLDAILRPIYEKYRDYFASEEVLDLHQNYEPGKLSYFVTSSRESSFQIWNPIAPLPLQIAEEMKEVLQNTFSNSK